MEIICRRTASRKVLLQAFGKETGLYSRSYRSWDTKRKAFRYQPSAVVFTGSRSYSLRQTLRHC